MLKTLFRRLRALVRGGKLDEDIQRELEFHVRMEAEQRERRGLSPDEARRTALRDFGGVGRIREEVRDARGMTFWDTLRQDLRFGVRTLLRSPGYAAAAVLILALGIGANTAIFSVVNGVLLEPLPYRAGGELMLIQQNVPSLGRTVGVSIGELQDYRERLQTIDDLVEYHSMSFTLLNQGEPDRVDTGVVSANFFDMLGVAPLMGRTFREGDDALGAEAVLVLSHAYWQQKFGGDETVVGRVLEMNNRPHTIVGILPPHPQYPRHNDVYMPTSACPFRAGAEPRVPQNHRAFGALNVFGRLASDSTVEQASAEVAGVAGMLDDLYPGHYTLPGSNTDVEFTAQTQPLQEQLVEGARPMLIALAGTTMLVLLIACANVANLALARTVRRRRELAVRSALGAGRGRLLRQLVTESVLVALVGGVLGLALAVLSLDLLTNFVSRFTPRTDQIAVDGGVLLFTLGVSVLTGIVFGAFPALTTRRGLSQAMRDGGVQAGEGAGRHRMRAGLVVAQVAVSFVLLVGAVLLLQSFYRLSTVPIGYRTDQVMTAATFGNFSNSAEAPRIQAEILERLRAAPGVRSAAMTNSVPQLAQTPLPRSIRLEGDEGSGERLEVVQSIASDDYFETLDVPLLAGRDFRPSDDLTAPYVAIVNQTMAQFWGGMNPVGRRFVVEGLVRTVNDEQIEPVYTVIGVVSDFRFYGADQDVAAQFYEPMGQAPGGGVRMLVRSDLDADAVIPIMKDAVFAVDDRTPVEEIQTLEQVRDSRLAVPGLTAALLGIFASVALIITLAGIAGVIGTSVSQRTREFGLRMALGASRVSVLQSVLRQGVILVAVGVVVGLGGAIVFSRLIESFLFATTRTDPLAYAVVSIVFVVAALVAAFGPARRATSIDPLTALRSE